MMLTFVCWFRVMLISLKAMVLSLFGVFIYWVPAGCEPITGFFLFKHLVLNFSFLHLSLKDSWVFFLWLYCPTASQSFV
jgi:hypothetical protein